MIDSSDSSEHSLSDKDQKSIAKGGVTTPFPWKLHNMLDDMADKGEHSVVTWQPHGRAFMVHKPKVFVEDIMHHYFNQTKYASFQRQLNLYGFSRLSHGKDKGAYYHMCFVRGERSLCRKMVRQKIKGTKVRRTLSPEEEPNFYLPHWKNSCNIEGIEAMSSSSEPTQSQPSQTSKATNKSRRISSKRGLKEGMDTSPPFSLVSMMKETSQAAPSFVPLPPLIQKSMQQIPPHAKAGDLLFFEGRPFRYLEHVEELPSVRVNTHLLNESQARGTTTYNETLHDMINSIVTMENTWKDTTNRNVCSV